LTACRRKRPPRHSVTWTRWPLNLYTIDSMTANVTADIPVTISY
jgi:hypothetical protein